MLQAERVLADAVLGYDGLTEDMLAALCGAVTEAHGEEAFASSLAASVRRKSALGALADAGRRVDDLLPNAAAAALRDSHSLIGPTAMQKYMEDAAGTLRGRELLLREALACDEGQQDVANAATKAVMDACDAKALRSLPAEVVTQACELSFPLFDRYVASLLGACAGGEEDGDPGAEFEAESRLQKLLARHG